VFVLVIVLVGGALALWLYNGFGALFEQRDLGAAGSLAGVGACCVLAGAAGGLRALWGIPLAGLLVVPLEIAISSGLHEVPSPPSGGSLEFSPLGALLIASPGAAVGVLVGSVVHRLTTNRRVRDH
jgi:hypothetical protein